jgi:hypothetical protein
LSLLSGGVFNLGGGDMAPFSLHYVLIVLVSERLILCLS